MSSRRSRRKSTRAQRRAGSDVGTASEGEDSLQPTESDDERDDLFEEKNGSGGNGNDDGHAVNNACLYLP